jgi:acyl dehydratase
MIDPQRLLEWPFEDVVQTYNERDATIYNLGIGLGSDPMDEGQLRFVTIERDLLAFPTMAVVLARAPSISADPRSGINRGMVVHGEQGLEILRPLRPAGTLRGRARVTHVVDKGQGKGAVIYQESTLTDDATGEPVSRLWGSTFARADGGFGGSPDTPRTPHRVPDTREPDAVCDLPTFLNSALLYRLNGDLNPLHSDPAAAKRAGFERPILHGLCTYGLSAHAVLRTSCGYDPAKLRGFDLRFSAPVIPGETVSVEMWRDGTIVSFRAFVRARNAKVVDNGRAVIAG